MASTSALFRRSKRSCTRRSASSRMRRGCVLMLRSRWTSRVNASATGRSVGAMCVRSPRAVLATSPCLTHDIGRPTWGRASRAPARQSHRRPAWLCEAEAASAPSACGHEACRGVAKAAVLDRAACSGSVLCVADAADAPTAAARAQAHWASAAASYGRHRRRRGPRRKRRRAAARPAAQDQGRCAAKAAAAASLTGHHAAAHQAAHHVAAARATATHLGTAT